MPTRKRKSGKGLPTPNGDRKYPAQKLDQAVLNGTKKIVKKGLDGYLKGTQTLADKISGKLPASMTTPKPSRRRRRGKRIGDVM